MMTGKRILILGCIGLGIVQSLCAQNEPADVASAADQFQDAFYESLTQKGIENYDKAIRSLEKCQLLDPNNAVVYFELGKNYLAQKEYNSAHAAFEKATQLDPMNRWFWVGLYDVYYETYEEAIPVVKQLIEFNLDYQEDLVSLYMNTQQFDKALVLINELNESKGKSELRDKYTTQILGQGKYQASEIDRLWAEIKNNPQYHLQANEGIQAAKSLLFVLGSPKVESKIKHRMLNEFLLFVQDKPQFDADFDKAVGLLVQDPKVAVNKEVGKFYQRKKNAGKAIYFYVKQRMLTPDDTECLQLLCELYTETAQFDVLASMADDAVERFPLQPQWYYYAGLANNQLKNAAAAIKQLESGLEYVLDDKALEINYYIQLGEAHHALGNEAQKEFYFNKAEALVQQAQKK